MAAMVIGVSWDLVNGGDTQPIVELVETGIPVNQNLRFSGNVVTMAGGPIRVCAVLYGGNPSANPVAGWVALESQIVLGKYPCGQNFTLKLSNSPLLGADTITSVRAAILFGSFEELMRT